jgi:hypothetical protein
VHVAMSSYLEKNSRGGEGWKKKIGGGALGQPEKMGQEVEGKKISFKLLGFESILNSNQN